MALVTRHQVLAWDLIEGLGDLKHKGIYFRLAKIYNEAFLREILSIVKIAHNESKIKANDRGRYFMGILKKEIEKGTYPALILRRKQRRPASPKKERRYLRRAGRKK